MRSALPDFLVDTNILVYAYDATEGFKRDRAQLVLRRLGTAGRGALTPQILGEFFVTALRKAEPKLSAAQLQLSVTNYARSWTILDLTANVVTEAIRGVVTYDLPYWDALIWACAKLNDVPVVLSEDFNTGALIEGVRFLNPIPPSFDLDLMLLPRR